MISGTVEVRRSFLIFFTTSSVSLGFNQHPN
jgi:hypothetical protein